MSSEREHGTRVTAKGSFARPISSQSPPPTEAKLMFSVEPPNALVAPSPPPSPPKPCLINSLPPEVLRLCFEFALDPKGRQIAGERLPLWRNYLVLKRLRMVSVYWAAVAQPLLFQKALVTSHKQAQVLCRAERMDLVRDLEVSGSGEEQLVVSTNRLVHNASALRSLTLWLIPGLDSSIFCHRSMDGEFL